MKIDIVYLNEKCKLVKGSEGAIGFDVRANIDNPIEVKPGDVVEIPLGFKIDTKEAELGMFLFIRSGMGIKHGLKLLNSVGVIDSDYRGECIACLWNTGARKKSYTIGPYDRIAQVVFLRAEKVELCEKDALIESERGQGGFGSTGKN